MLCRKEFFYGCVMYADDLLMSVSVAGLQSMLDVCFAFGVMHSMIFNPKKDHCVVTVDLCL